MPNKIAVIGVGGVGMAHVVAAGRLGWQVVALVDNDTAVLRQAKKRWVNIWESVVEETPVQDGAWYFETMDALSEVGHLNVVVIATPPHTHNDILAQLANFANVETIICEKPLSYPQEPIALPKEFNTRVFCSAEWVNHDLVGKAKDIDFLGMWFEKAETTHWGYKMPRDFDLMPHLFSILWEKKIRYDDVVKVSKNDYVVVSHGEGIQLSFDPIEGRGLFVNTGRSDWQDDLFDQQLRKMNLPTWNEAREWEMRLRYAYENFSNR